MWPALSSSRSRRNLHTVNYASRQYWSHCRRCVDAHQSRVGVRGRLIRGSWIDVFSSSKSGGRLICVSPYTREYTVVLGVNTRLSKYTLRLPRRDVRILVRLRIGHNTLNRHLALLKKQSDALCPLCEDEQETSLHFLGRCSATMVWRIQYFERPFLSPCELRQEHWATVLRFAKTSKRF